jgi:hypothetical protein
MTTVQQIKRRAGRARSALSTSPKQAEGYHIPSWRNGCWNRGQSTKIRNQDSARRGQVWVFSHSLGQKPESLVSGRTSALASCGHARRIGLGRLGRVEDGRGSLGHAATLRFPSPLIEPDVRISRIRLSDWLRREAHGAITDRKRHLRGVCPIGKPVSTPPRIAKIAKPTVKTSERYA